MDRANWLISRRGLLGGLGLAGLSALLPRGALAAGPAKRLIVFYVSEGLWRGAPRPSAGATTLGSLLDPLDPHRSNLLVLNHLSMASRDHGPGTDGHARGVLHLLTGTEMQDDDNAGGESVDQKVAKAISGGATFGSLQAGVRIIYNDSRSFIVWKGSGQGLPAEQSPYAVYQRVFGNFQPPTASGTPKPDLRKSALDFSRAEMNALTKRLPTSDRQRVESYQESLREIERRLATTLPASCTKPSLGNPIDHRAEPNYPEIGKLHMDLMVAALQCGLTNVATLQWGNSNDQALYSWLGIDIVGHDLAHNNGNCDPDGSKKLTRHRWYASQFAYLIGKLKAIPEGSGTMLDNTLVLWASEFSDCDGHASDDLLWVLAGNVGGYFKTGRVVDCGGRSTNDLHTSICNAYGITGKFGNPAYCDGPLPNLT